ncbi:bile acid:sodium symporter family protein [Aeoliella mucimassa]|uniref:bile acid:sodium symporter family protein n=1 Tax=Aeoliella mucimassa TaxID=2527972 RepID=UPI001E571B1E|nr:bile acid:sodium symporter [Aeoliella mucimassa]
MSQAIRHRLPLLLVVCYAVALLVPAPGQWIHDLKLPTSWPELARPNVSQLMVAVLLFLAALGVEVRRLPLVGRRPLLVVLILAAVWLVPALVVMLVWWVMPLVIDAGMATKLLMGFVLVAAMPVANSAAAWTQQSRGELPWALAMVVLSIVACPWMIPLVLKLMGLSFSEGEADALKALTASFTGLHFVVWVLLPTAAGIVTRWIVGRERVAKHRPEVLLTSAITLLVLNYINAACALPKMADDFRIGWLVFCVALASGQCLVGLGASQLLGEAFRVPSGTTTALNYALTMKNTGLAVALASRVLEGHEILLLPVFTTTLVQHLFAGALHRRSMARVEKELAQPPESE